MTVINYTSIVDTTNTYQVIIRVWYKRVQGHRVYVFDGHNILLSLSYFNTLLRSKQLVNILSPIRSKPLFNQLEGSLENGSLTRHFVKNKNLLVLLDKKKKTFFYSIKTMQIIKREGTYKFNKRINIVLKFRGDFDVKR